VAAQQQIAIGTQPAIGVVTWCRGIGSGDESVVDKAENMTLLLGGGGDAEEERPVLDRFVELASGGAIGYWPFALDLDNYDEATAYAEAALRGVVETWPTLDGRTAADIGSLAGIFIGGGNTYHLLNEVRRHRFVDPLRAFAASRPLYGGSAGAILLGADIGPAGHFDRNDVGITDTTGLGLLHDHAVWCHYVLEHGDPLRAWVQSASHPIVALTERSGVEVNGATLGSIGHEPVHVIGPNGQAEELPPGRSYSLG
jgi:dipeptidase E